MKPPLYVTNRKLSRMGGRRFRSGLRAHQTRHPPDTLLDAHIPQLPALQRDRDGIIAYAQPACGLFAGDLIQQ
jgi:hypothetical protein